MQGGVGNEHCESCGCEAVRSRVLGELSRLGWDESRISRDLIFTVDLSEGPREVRIDVMGFDQGRPVLLVECAPGHLAVRGRAAVAKARLFPGGPVPLVLVANDRDAVVIDVESGREVGFEIDSLAGLLSARSGPANPFRALPPQAVEREKRVLAAYDELGCGGGRDIS